MRKHLDGAAFLFDGSDQKFEIGTMDGFKHVMTLQDADDESGFIDDDKLVNTVRFIV